MSARFLKAILGACLAVIAVTSARADLALVPHQAVYRMTLVPGSETLDVVSANGVMIYRAAQECGGWTVENQTAIRFRQPGGEVFEDRWAFASWEAEDGLSYRFRAIHNDGKNGDRIEGTATLDRVGGEGVAAFTAPRDFEIDLPEGTLFPTAHLRRLLVAARDDEKILTRVIFDGTTEENPYLVNVVIASRDPNATPLAEALGAPAAAAFWTRGAYFSYRGGSEVPDFEMTIELRLDGIAERVEQSFDNLGLRGKLLSLELLSKPDC